MKIKEKYQEAIIARFTEMEHQRNEALKISDAEVERSVEFIKNKLEEKIKNFLDLNLPGFEAFLKADGKYVTIAISIAFSQIGENVTVEYEMFNEEKNPMIITNVNIITKELFVSTVNEGLYSKYGIQVLPSKSNEKYTYVVEFEKNSK